MGYRRLGHTADTGLELRARSRSELFREAIKGFTDTVVDLASVEPREEVAISCRASEPELLLVACLEELVYEFEVRGRVFCDADCVVTGEGGRWRIEAKLGGEAYDPLRHRLRVPIKGVTYHGLEVRESAEGWRGTVVFDI